MNALVRMGMLAGSGLAETIATGFVNLAIAGLSARDIMAYCLIILLASGIVAGLGLTLL